VIRPALLCSALLTGGPLVAQAPTDRWSFQVAGETLADRGELRLERDSGRLLLISDDRAWQPITIDSLNDRRIVFRFGPALTFSGDVTSERMSGTVRERGEPVATWEASAIQPGTERWPVRPRVTVRQVITGRADTIASFAAPLMRRTPGSEAILAEHATLAARMGLPPADQAAIAARSRGMMLGFAPLGRDAAEQLLLEIASTPAADAHFRALFIGPEGHWRLDLHDAAWQFAIAARGQPLNPDSLITLLTSLGARTDRASLRQTIWQLWGRQQGREMREAFNNAIAEHGSPAARDLQSLMTGYDFAVGWWLQAVEWLMESDWIRTDSGWTSPATLVGRFWNRDSLQLPAIEPIHYGTVQAAPVIPLGPLEALLVMPSNAIAEEWLQQPERRAELLAAWRQLDIREPVPLAIDAGEGSMPVASTAEVINIRLGGFLAPRAAIRIEPAILPVFAVGTVVHEWQHILFEEARGRGDNPRAWRITPWGVKLFEADPWLGEGAAEWATEEIFASVRQTAPVFTLTEIEKRLTIAAMNADDPHVLGYLLVRAAADAIDNPERLRDALVAHLEDPEAFARAVGLSGSPGRNLVRPSTAMLIPEVTFTLDGDAVERPRRRLVIPASAGAQ